MTSRRAALSVFLLGLFVIEARAQTLAPDHAAKMAKGLDLFKKAVRPILETHCLKCHGGKSVEAELDLADRDVLLKGGVHGKVVDLEKPAGSRLLKMIRHQQEPFMPKDRPKLPEESIAQIATWIELGAPYDSPLLAARKAKVSWTQKEVPAEAKAFWSFQPLKRVEPPPVKNTAWPRTEVDRFVLAAMEKVKITPSVPASKLQLIRRAYFDLIGLPPTPEEIDAFLNDRAADAWPRLIDKLLASPHYGERWARHWLDLARFAESHGFEHDYDRPTAYHYRDFVIEALNRDLPYNTFVRWQIAGDEYEPDNHLAVKATGFLAAGVHSTQITKAEAEKHRYDELDDKLNTLGTAFLGLSIGCARCHDHKYDPIPARDYYRMLSTFTKTVRAEMDLSTDPSGREVVKPVVTRPKKETGPTPPASASEKKIVRVLVATEGVPAVRLHTQGDDFYPETYYLRRGDSENKEGVAEQGFLQVLMPASNAESRWRRPAPTGSRTPWKRHALAEWITDTEAGAGNLLARVIVNRLWQHHLGRGLVATPSDFGVRGERPTHPELLDYLARQLIETGWSLKAIHKLILTSNVYQQSSATDESRVRVDRDNKHCWHNPSRRLSAEVIRDALLAVSGELDPTLFGPGTLDESSRRRSIYFTVKRSKLMPMMVIFDAPEALNGMADRPTTTIAPQALHLMNNANVRRYARSLAARLGEPSIDRAYQITLGRPATADERADGMAFLREQAATYPADGETRALVDFCQVLLCLNEFVYVD